MTTKDFSVPYHQFFLSATHLKHHTDPATLPDKARLSATDSNFVQKRAIDTITTALAIKADGYHVFAVGEAGLGKRTAITHLLTRHQHHAPTPKDWVYVHNFDDIRRPLAISLPTGTAKAFQQKIHTLWHTAKKRLSTTLLGEHHQQRCQAIKSAFHRTQKHTLDALSTQAKAHRLSLSFDDGFGQLIATDDSVVIDNTAKDTLERQLKDSLKTLDTLEQSTHDKIDALYQHTANKLLAVLFAPLFDEFDTHADIISYLKRMRDDMVHHVVDILDDHDDFSHATFADVPSRYFVNIIISHTPKMGVPIVFEPLPTHFNLLGHVEYRTELGTPYSDVSMIRAGALHRANGGYLLIKAQSLLEQPYAWQGLKHALQGKQIGLSSLEHMLTLTGSVSLDPVSIPLDVKVILLGDDQLYDELSDSDPEFLSLFGLRADFQDTTEKTDDSTCSLLLKIQDIIEANALPSFEPTALASVLDELSTLADNQQRFDLHMGNLRKLLLESALVAHQDHKNSVHGHHVKRAIANRHYRQGHLQSLYWQDIDNGQQLISTQGYAIGQINALTVISHADGEFGLPARLSAVIAPKFGTGEILDIERDVELGGSLHAKGMLIMTSFLRSLFSEFSELNFSASLTFEQNYGHIDGDSATLAECVALLSALADAPINQALAITGSMNQLGQAQAIGGVNAKITGFFDVCAKRGLDGTQGVIIPRANLTNLMLHDTIINAVNDGKFAIYAVDNIYDALAILMDMPICDKNKKGEYKKNTLFGKIISRLLNWQDDEKDKK